MVSCKCIWRNYTSIEISLFQLFELNYGGSEGKIRNWFWYDISMTWCREHKYCAHIVLENNSVNYLFKNGKQLTLQLLPSWHLNTVGTYVQQGPIKGEIKSPQYNCEPLVLTGFKCSGSTPIKMGWLLHLIRRSNVEPKCGNNSSESSHVPVVRAFRLSYVIDSVLVDGPCSATYCEPAKQYLSSRGVSLAGYAINT